jgi:Thioesterase-like superfamily
MVAGCREQVAAAELEGADYDVRMTAELAHFILTEGGDFAPTEVAQSHWGKDHLSGPAVVGLAARSLELDCGSPDFMPSRLTVDLFRAARGVPTAVAVHVVRDGRRIRSAECDVAQDGRLVARATLLQYRRSAAPPGRLWAAPMTLPPLPSPDDKALTHVGSEGAHLSRSSISPTILSHCGSDSSYGAAVPRDSPGVNVTGSLASPVMLGLPRYSCTPPRSTW